MKSLCVDDVCLIPDIDNVIVYYKVFGTGEYSIVFRFKEGKDQFITFCNKEIRDEVFTKIQKCFKDIVYV